MHSSAAVPSLSGSRDPFCGRQFFHGSGSIDGFRMIQVRYIYWALYFYFMAISGYSALTLGLGFMLLQEFNVAADLTGDGAQAVMQAMGSGYKYR